jgi:NADPH-dependent 2,4-dienoyl-CoA reductase/sulfur reductase-like enzyme/nitrite reductase/ring-hydroxylating ferredoxin subunit
MGGAPGELSGPDLAAGLAIGDVPDGGSVVGHAQGEAVLLVRKGDDLFAVGATCTHYGAPLADGLVDGETVRCPWHHACFSLRTGEALRAPALSPIACWKVERDGDTVKVGEKLAPPRAEKRAAPPGEIVIVGGGAAGAAAALHLRAKGYVGRLTMISAEDTGPVDRPNLSKDYLAGNAPEEWIPLRAPEAWMEQGIELLTSTPVASLDLPGHKVVFADGRTRGYDALLLATGARPVRPPVPGSDLPHVHTLRTLADSRALIERVPHTVRAIVVGASFIGLEVAASLRARNIDVHVVAQESRLFEKIFGGEVGDFLRGVHEKKEVEFHLGHGVARIEEKAVVLASGETISGDLVILGTGVRPEIGLAEAAGLEIDRGIVVDAQLATSAPRVWAAGDVARYPDPITGERVRIEHWVVAQRQGQVAAENMLGGAVRFDHAPFFWSAHHDVTLAYVGHAESWDRSELEGSLEERNARVRYYRGDKLLATLTVGRDRESLEAELELERRARPT